MHTRRFVVPSMLAVVALALSPMRADAAAVGMSARDEALANFAAFMSEPPVVDVVATLEAPVTTYDLVVSREWYAQYEAMAKALDGVGVKVGESGPKHGEISWTGEISCGRLRDHNYLQFRWIHPDGPPPDCPHEQGTDHPGTITITNLPYRFALREEIEDDEKMTSDESMAKLDAAPRLAEYLWTFECRYADGSKPGRARCTGTLRTGQDAAGGSGAATNTNTAGEGQGSGAGAAGAAAGAVAIGAAAYWWWRRPFDWQEIQRRWKIK